MRTITSRIDMHLRLAARCRNAAVYAVDPRREHQLVSRAEHHEDIAKRLGWNRNSTEEPLEDEVDRDGGGG